MHLPLLGAIPPTLPSFSLLYRLYLQPNPMIPERSSSLVSARTRRSRDRPRYILLMRGLRYPDEDITSYPQITPWARPVEVPTSKCATVSYYYHRPFRFSSHTL
jgi:hypothetical protein